MNGFSVRRSHAAAPRRSLQLERLEDRLVLAGDPLLPDLVGGEMLETPSLGFNYQTQEIKLDGVFRYTVRMTEYFEFLGSSRSQYPAWRSCPVTFCMVTKVVC